jgi:acyl-CoA oxidase
MQEIEALAAGMKAYSTWSTTAVLQECRSYWQRLFIGKSYRCFKNDTEIYTTFEGNTVLMQLVAKIVYPNSGNHLAGCHGA